MISTTDKSTDKEELVAAMQKRTRYRRNFDADCFKENYIDVCSQTRRKWNSRLNSNCASIQEYTDIVRRRIINEINSDSDQLVDQNSIPNHLSKSNIVDENEFNDNEKIESKSISCSLLDESSYMSTSSNHGIDNDNLDQQLQESNTECDFNEQIEEIADQDDYNSFTEYNSCTDNISDSSSNENADNFNSIEEHPIFSKIMFESSNLSINDVIILCSAFSLRFQLSDEGKLELLKLLTLCAGPRFKNLSLSKYIISQCFSAQTENLTYHYFCYTCSKQIVYSTAVKDRVKKKQVICTECQIQNLIRTNTPNYFISIDLSYQIKQLFANECIFENIIQNVQARTASILNCNNKIKDVCDGEICKKLFQSKTNKEFEYLLTFNFNTDGAPLTKSGKRAFWPLQLILNDLSPKFRFKYLFLAGLLITAKEPKSDLMNLYMSKFCEEISKFTNEGVVLKQNNITYTFKLCVANCVVDSVARPVTQNRVQFNGYCGCSWCYQLGSYVDSVKGIRYLFEQECTLRKHETHMRDVENATETKTIKRGVKGFSSLQYLYNFDMVWSYSYEYMHGLLLGVTLQIWNEWKNGCSLYKLSNKHVKEVERRYLSITPTHEIHRLPRAGIFQGSMKPKASEMKSWLIHFSLPCLKGLLNEEALVHYSLLVKSAYTLLKTEITKNDLRECEFDLLKFVCEYEMLYGEERMTFNVHALLHIAQSVRRSGPISMNSAFPFESNIYTLKTYIKGPNGVDRQMAKKMLQTWTFKTGNTKSLSPSQEVQNYCNTLYKPRELTTYQKDHSNNVTFVGKSVIDNEDYLNEDMDYLVYKKCIFKGVVYHSIQYKRTNKTDDTVVQLQEEKFGRILKIIDINGQCYLKISYFELFNDNPFPGVSHIKKIRSENNNYIYASISDIKCKAILINVKNARYLSVLPNYIEIQ